ncbi:MAG: ornithine cyclodeaminase family protein [Pseudomonadota bacterium]
MELKVFNAQAVAEGTPWVPMIDAIRDAFRAAGVSPMRHHHAVPGVAEGDDDLTLLLMPAWHGQGGAFGLKVAALSPTNASVGLPTLHGVYLLFEPGTGVPRALLDAGALTARRTAAASALASRYLSRENAQTLFVIGTGRVARELISAHCAVRPIREVRVWGRRPERAQALVEAVSAELDAGQRCVSVADVASGAAGADIISAATGAKAPLLRSEWVEDGTHVDLVGAYTPAMCEADPALVGRSDQVFIDTWEGARDEAGDLLQAISAGAFSFDSVAGDLYQMCAHDGGTLLRRSAQEITLYKSVGTALQDLAAAELCVTRAP